MGDIEFGLYGDEFPEIERSGWDRSRELLENDDTPGVDPLADRLVEEGERSLREAQATGPNYSHTHLGVVRLVVNEGGTRVLREGEPWPEPRPETEQKDAS